MKFLIALGTLALGVAAVPPNNPGAVVPSSVTSDDDTLSTKAPATVVATALRARAFNVPPNNPGAVVPSSVTADDALSTKAPATAEAAVVLVRDFNVPTVSVNSAGQLQQGFEVHQPKDWVRSWGSLYVPELFHYNFDDLDDGSPEAEAMRQLMKKYPDVVHRDDQHIFEGLVKSQQGAKPSSTKSVKRQNIQARGIPSGKHLFISTTILLEETN